MGLERPTVLAHSFGSVLAILFALQHPDRLSRLVIIGGAPTREFMTGYRKAVAAELPPEVQERLAAIQAGEIDDDTMRERFRLALPLYSTSVDRRGARVLLSTISFSGNVNRAVAAGLDRYDLSPRLPHIGARAGDHGTSDRSFNQSTSSSPAAGS